MNVHWRSSLEALSVPVVIMKEKAVVVAETEVTGTEMGMGMEMETATSRTVGTAVEREVVVGAGIRTMVVRVERVEETDKVVLGLTETRRAEMGSPAERTSKRTSGTTTLEEGTITREVLEVVLEVAAFPVAPFHSHSSPVNHITAVAGTKMAMEVTCAAHTVPAVCGLNADMEVSSQTGPHQHLTARAAWLACKWVVILPTGVQSRVDSDHRMKYSLPDTCSLVC
mmetsp:Transcript_33826/g.40892  ORF Transcript_33826/g.40892 Transcript_33826/m.40892 type:complete len:226 (+) Transcript_33826:640-1317(+)